MDTHVLRARLTPSSRHDGQRAKVHDFRNRLAALVLATQLEERALVLALTDELAEEYKQALSRKRKGATMRATG